MSLTFEPVPHQYRWNGAVVPSVTQALRKESGYSRFDPAVLEQARQKGENIHQMIAFDCRGDLDEDNLPAWMRPALAEWRKFVHTAGFKVLLSEEKLYHPFYRFAGTCDLFGQLAGRRYALVDVKRSYLGGPAIGLQLAGYEMGIYEHPIAKELAIKRGQIDRYALRIREDKRFDLRRYDDSTDATTFIAALTMHRWREKNHAE